jgi:phage-related protein
MRQNTEQPRGVAQSGSALGWGPSGRRFKSCLPDRKSVQPLRQDATNPDRSASLCGSRRAAEAAGRRRPPYSRKAQRGRPGFDVDSAWEGRPTGHRRRASTPSVDPPPGSRLLQWLCSRFGSAPPNLRRSVGSHFPQLGPASPEPKGERGAGSTLELVSHARRPSTTGPDEASNPSPEFIERLPKRHAAKIHGFIREYLNDLDPAAPPAPFPASSQIKGELRELRIRFANLRYRVIYRRSANLIVLLHAFEKTTGATPLSEIETAERRMLDFRQRMDAARRASRRAVGRDAP